MKHWPFTPQVFVYYLWSKWYCGYVNTMKSFQSSIFLDIKEGMRRLGPGAQDPREVHKDLLQDFYKQLGRHIHPGVNRPSQVFPGQVARGMQNLRPGVVRHVQMGAYAGLQVGWEICFGKRGTTGVYGDVSELGNIEPLWLMMYVDVCLRRWLDDATQHWVGCDGVMFLW